MANEYCFHCPIKGDGVKLTHCEAVHSSSMQGRSHEIEDKVCALAHLSWMCPARNAFRVGGPWSHYETKPFSVEPMEKPAKLPKDLELYALSHMPPKGSDYRRCGLRGDQVGIYDDLFRALNNKAVGQGSEVSRPSVSNAPKQTRKSIRKTGQSKSPGKLQTAADVVGQGGDDMAAAVTELARKEAVERQSQKSPQKRETHEMTRDKREAKNAPQRANQAPTDAPKRKMSLAERAKQMKARKSA